MNFLVLIIIIYEFIVPNSNSARRLTEIMAMSVSVMVPAYFFKKKKKKKKKKTKKKKNKKNKNKNNKNKNNKNFIIGTC